WTRQRSERRVARSSRRYRRSTQQRNRARPHGARADEHVLHLASGNGSSMTQSIQHENEPRANALRTRLDAINGLGQRTYTPTQIVVARAKGVRLWTVDGTELIDFTSGVLVSNLGHNHPLFEERYRHYC